MTNPVVRFPKEYFVEIKPIMKKYNCGFSTALKLWLEKKGVKQWKDY